MSDTGRQSFTDKAGSAMKPDSQKSTMEQASDYVKGKADSGASVVQGQTNQKSTSQTVGDSMTGNSEPKSESLVDKARSAFGMQDNN